jgi:hypothetical protein
VVEAYRGRRVALLTQHGKERVIAPALEGALGCTVERALGFDTDLLGTFTREVPRAGTQLEAARRKAELAIELSGADAGLGSEGSVDRHPMLSFVDRNMELIVLIDRARGIEVVGVADGPAPYAHVLTSALADAEAFAARTAVAGQGLIVRPESADDPRVRKDILSLDELRAAFADAQRESETGAVFIELDLRAHRNPRRMSRIAEAAADLAAKLASPCPACDGPGFWLVERLPGMPCRDCGLATDIALAEVDACPGCGHRATRLLDTAAGADPQWCDYCNP